MIQPERIRHLNERPVRKGTYVLCWMQASPRLSCNHALQYAIRQANRLGLPVVAFFSLVPGYPEAAPAHYRFMLEGLDGLRKSLAESGIQLVIRVGPPLLHLPDLSGEAALVVTDRGYLPVAKEWKESVARQISCHLTQVESDVVVPVESASPKEEWAAATFRPKINAGLDRFLVSIEEQQPDISSLALDIGGDDTHLPSALIPRLVPDTGLSQHDLPWTGGERAAHDILDRFLRERLGRYVAGRNDPNAGALSDLSPYLHFGQISPLEIALRVLATGHPDARVYLEELIVRRELAVNFVHYNQDFASYDGLPAWARKTLTDHAGDHREYTYTLKEFETAQTHDPYWNAAQQEMVLTGKMHGYLRMYWGKKILEWTKTPEDGFSIALALNNRYELDGRDPNGYAGVAWCFGKHDRAWPERPIFGKIRYMNANGLKRKFDADRYVARIDELKEKAEAHPAVPASQD